MMRQVDIATCCWIALAFGLVAALKPGDASGQDRAADSRAAESVAADRLYQSATGLLSRGLYELAADEFRRFLETASDHPQAPTARYALAVCLHHLGQVDAAERELLPLAEMPAHPFATEVLALLGQCQLSRGDATAAFQTLQRARAAHAEHELAADLTALAIEAAAGAREYELCGRLAGEFAARWPENARLERVLWFAASSSAARGEWKTACDQLAALLARFPAGAVAAPAALLRAQCLERIEPPASVAAYQELLDSADASVALEARVGLARAQFAAGDASSAAKNAEQLLRDKRAVAQREALLLLAGRARLERKQYQRADEHFRAAAALENAARADECAFWLARCAMRQQEPARAAELLAGALRAYPESAWRAELVYELAAAHAAAEDHERAVAAFEQFLAMHPAHALAADARAGRAAALHQLKRYADSVRACEEFLEQHPQHPLAAQARLLAGESEFLANRFEPALRHYRALLFEHPDAPQAGPARVRAGLALARLERIDEAIEALQSALDVAEHDPALRGALLTLADLQATRERWPATIATLERYLQSDSDPPGAAEALLSLGLARRQCEQHDAALEAFQRCAQLAETAALRARAAFERAQTLALVGRTEPAAAAFREVLEMPGVEPPIAGPAAQHLANLALRRGAADEARTWARRAIELQPDAPASAARTLLLAQALFAAGELPAAVEALDAALKGELDGPQRGVALALRAQALARQGRHVEALAALDAASNTDLDDATRCTLTYERSLCLKALTRADEACESLRALLERCPQAAERPYAVLELAELEVARGADESATALLRTLLTESAAEDAGAALPAEVRARALYRLGLLDFNAGRHAQAAERLGAFLQSEPTGEVGASAAFYCGEAHRLAGHADRAVPWLRRVLALDAEPETAALAQLRLGEALAALQRWEQSAAEFAAFVRGQPNHDQWHQAQFGLGWALENAGQIDQAVSAYQAVIDRHKGPTAARAQFQIGECRFAQKRYEDAVRELLRVEIFYAYPEWSAAALFEAGRCFEAMNRPVEARQHFERVRQEFADSPWARSASQRLAALGSAAPPGHQRRATP